MARLDTVISFSRGPDDAADQPDNNQEHPDAVTTYDNGGSDDDAGSEFEFEFAFAPPLTAEGRGAEEDGLAPADDLFAHGQILPAYPVFDRGASLRGEADGPAAPQASTAPPSPDTYCAWAPSRSAPGSPARAFPKSASTGEARGFWRLRDLVGGRSHSDGKEKFVFLQPTAPSKTAEGKQQANNMSKPSAPPQQKQSKKRGNKKAGAVAEMDMATAHKLFYGKPGALPGAAAAAGDRKQHSYLPYRTGIVGFFATAHALGRSHHPY